MGPDKPGQSTVTTAAPRDFRCYHHGTSNQDPVAVVLDDSGFSKGFGFIRFNNETEQQTALTSMQGVSGLGGKPLKVDTSKKVLSMEIS